MEPLYDARPLLARQLASGREKTPRARFLSQPTGCVLWRYTLVRIKVLDEAHELERRLGERVEVGDAVFQAPPDEPAIETAADTLEALARRLVAGP